MRWKIDECPDAEGNWTLREDDGTEHGNTETCIATVYGGEQEQNLIESAPLLAEQARILREAAQRVIDNWDSGDLADSVRELSLILEATKEGSEPCSTPSC